MSGGKDSDIMVDILAHCDTDKKLRYVWFNTGLEYQATKNHIGYLEDKYDINIERINAIKPIPLAVREFGQPFISKYISEQIGRLQKCGFQWEDEPIEQLKEKYTGCDSALTWWCNDYTQEGYTPSYFSIGYTKHLKEFLMENPPEFKISRKCCDYTKKKVVDKYIKKNDIQCQTIGIRRAEGGIRKYAYKSCYTEKTRKNYAEYRPLFWYTNDDEQWYKETYGIVNSDCYEVYGLKRTGCVGCPYSRRFNFEMMWLEQYEPNVVKACRNVFKESYEYTLEFRRFQKRKEREKNES